MSGSTTPRFAACASTSARWPTRWWGRSSARCPTTPGRSRARSAAGSGWAPRWRCGASSATRAMPRVDDVYRRLGAGEYRAGRSLDALQSAYRVGARVAWRKISEAAEAAGASPRGAAQSRRGDVRLHRPHRRRVGRGLRRGAAQRRRGTSADGARSSPRCCSRAWRPTTPSCLRAAELGPGWPLPRTVACLGRGRTLAPRRARSRLSGEALAAARRRDDRDRRAAAGVPWSVRRRLLSERLGLRAGLRPAGGAQATQAPRCGSRAARSRWPRTTCPAGGRRAAARRIALNAAPEILTALRARLLAPLDGQTEGQPPCGWRRRCCSGCAIGAPQGAAAAELGGPSADGALPDGAAARPDGRDARGPGRALRARDGPAGGLSSARLHSRKTLK